MCRMFDWKILNQGFNFYNVRATFSKCKIQEFERSNRVLPTRRVNAPEKGNYQKFMAIGAAASWRKCVEIVR